MESFYFRLVLQAADYLKISPRQLARAQIDDAKRTTTSYSQSKRAHTLALNGVAFVSHWPSGSTVRLSRRHHLPFVASVEERLPP